MDTAAEVTAILHFAYQQLSNPPLLNTFDKILYGPSRQPLHVLGQCHMDLTYKEKSCNHQVYVVKGLQKNLLELAAITSLSLAARVKEVSLTASDVHMRFP